MVSLRRRHRIAKRASLRSHLVVKSVGAEIAIEGSFIADTKDDAGSPIDWNYRVVSELGETINGVFMPESAGFMTQNFIRLANQTMVYGHTHTAPAADHDRVLDVRVMLWGADADGEGNPISNQWVFLDQADHFGAVSLVLPPTTQPTPTTPIYLIGDFVRIVGMVGPAIYFEITDREWEQFGGYWKWNYSLFHSAFGTITASETALTF